MGRKIAITALAGAVLACTPSQASAKVPVPSDWKGQIKGEVYGQSFTLPFRIEITRRLRKERNPFHLFAGTSSQPSNDVGSSLLTSAQRYLTPITGRKAILRYLQVTANGGTIRAKLVNTHQDEAAVINGFTAPNVCLSVYTPFECVIPGPELFAFHKGATVELRISGRQMRGSLVGTGFGYTQILPYPEVRYSGTITAKRRR